MVITETLKINSLPQTKPLDPPRWQPGVGVANGTFGELLQGALQNNDDHFLVTLPIQKFSTARFTPDATTARITVSPAHKTKSQKLAQKLLQHYGCEVGGHLTIESELPEGKGLASSSADMVATVRALEVTLGHAIPTELVLATLRTIEPTDGVMYHEFVTFFHRKVELVRRLGFPSSLKVVAIDAGGQVDTIEYNKHNYQFTDEECAEYADLLASLESAIRLNDLQQLGRITTRSAILNQKRNPNPYLDRVLEIGQETGALGVVVAHSGPCVGLLFPNELASERQIADARFFLAELTEQVFTVESLVSSSASFDWPMPNREAIFSGSKAGDTMQTTELLTDSFPNVSRGFMSSVTAATAPAPSRKQTGFDPFVDLLSAQVSRPLDLQSLDLRTLTPFQRALVSIDGTVTKFIEAYRLEPVESVLLTQQPQLLQADHPWLGLPAGSEVITRQVLLRGRYTNTTYAYAVSLLAPDRLPQSLLRDLALEPAGIGRVLLNSQIEHRREILWYGRENLTQLPDAIDRYTGNDFISRTYRILVQGQPVMLISEKFPRVCPTSTPAE